MSRFFIDRPIFAWVLAIVVMLAGILAIKSLPVAQYPSIAPPAISIQANYPGASARTLEDTVTQVIEQKMKGLDGLLYMSSTSESNGSATLTLTFSADTDPDIAQVQVQNKLSLATPLLPEEVQRQGVSVAKSARNFLMVVGFVSEDGSMNNIDIGDYVSSNVLDIISRVNGVGEVQLFGSQYAMRIWLDPSKLQKYALTPADISAAISAQNAQVSAGQLGALPAVDGQQLNATVTAQSRLQTPEQFRDIFVKTNPDGSVVRLSDVAKVELGGENYGVVARFNGKPASGLGVKLASGANALDTADGVKAALAELEPFFPEGLTTVVPYDTTPFVSLSIEKVVSTLIEAVVLVFLVMYLFLQNFRATLIPTIAVPVVLLGTFAILQVFGYSINTLTMFAMVLAIGLLVDDAIVVVENVERVMTEENLSPLEATRKSMDEIKGALVGIAMVLSAVFVPMAFFAGSTGVIYRQFSITLVTAMSLSVLVALILTPALCATMLKPSHVHNDKSLFGRFFLGFNRGFDKTNAGAQGFVARMIKHSKRYLLCYGLIVGGMVYIFSQLPSAFLPDEDQGILFNQVSLPAGSTTEQTLKVVEKMEHHFLEDQSEAVKSIFTVTGFSFAGSGQNAAIGFVGLKHWDERQRPDLSVGAVAGKAMGYFSTIKEAFVFAFPPPAVVELGTANGFTLFLQDRVGLGHDKLLEARNMFLGMAAKNPVLSGVRPNGQEDKPELELDIDLAKAEALGLTQTDINNTLSTAWGSRYVNDFIDRGRVKKVYLQGTPESRMVPEDLDKWYVRNANGDMVPFTAFAHSYWTYGSPRLERYNGFSAMEIQGAAAPGYSTGQAMVEVEKIVKQLPPGVAFEWTGISYEERLSGGQAPLLYALSLLVVFLCLAALYESWSVPAAVMLIVPLGVFGAGVASFVFNLSNDIYLQVGLLTTIGLASKNAILIVEFAIHKMDEGMKLVDAAIAAIRLRLRPIFMTSMAFVCGVLPLAIASSAGSGAQNALGIAVIGGTLASSTIVVLFVPLFFVLVRRVFPGKQKVNSEEQA
ncbi:multidrug efflux RND transporter permease subunit (plasmid) [Pseudoalteromonas lipolytica]|jgi:multidrug efflux pump|uniref:Efflux pump membrane transporter n=2 Tax=Pseudoalteromonas lipolytica TaxID=570156 RepID=A0AAD0WE69_9GAMM|nr:MULTISPECIES: efflux RND transporter permease subunit [Pseudoalteromonas]AXV67180.1 multidrug efflux RND transporter permease subunit [Pseudoalteromonas donghaensis]EWH05670.1 multidrug transporter [Pseudoalteromonas lipolytica SCSIO 04301]MCC9660516.1 efflux RND transporter permease subunit [Pseudoalteromonas sp. MB41]QLJ10412.1 efflux RND transporter permease subunit [Pseudoalteromonas sp. JSTW]QMW16559.1 efflux RND transporter permease subunit [Pseudoalteromonas sp. MT33b]